MTWYNPLTWFNGKPPADAGATGSARVLGQYADDLMGELLVQELTGLPILWKPLRQNGTTEFTDHPEGEGYSLKSWARDQSSGRYTAEQLADWRAGCFQRVRMSCADARTFFIAEDDPSVADIALHPVTGKPMETKWVRPCQRFEPTAILSLSLGGAALKLDGPGDQNVLASSVLAAPDTVKPVTFEEAQALAAELDTARAAILTVGNLMMFATIGAAYAAAASGDTIQVYAGGVGNTYFETITITKQLMIIAMAPGLTISHPGPGATVYVAWNTARTFVRFRGFTIIASGGNNGYGMSNNLNTDHAAEDCIIMQTGVGGVGASLASASSAGAIGAINCAISGFDVGIVCLASRAAMAASCSVYNCATAGISSGGAVMFARYCLAAGNGVDYTGLAAASCWNVSGDLTAPGVSPATGFLVADWVNPAAGDLRLKPTVALTTMARFAGVMNYRKDFIGQERVVGDHFFAGCSTINVPPTWGVGEPSGIS